MLLILTVLFLAIIHACEPRPRKVEFALYPFDIRDVTLLDGPFKNAKHLNEKILLSFEPDRFLAGFRTEAGLEPKAEQYGGWETSSIAGHSLGHYLSAIAMMYQATGNEEFLNRLNYIVDELYIVQQANGGGYLGAFPDGQRVFEEEIAKGEIRASGFDLNGIWAPWYNHHKIFAGLRDAYNLAGNQKALEIAQNFANWVDTIVGHLPNETVREMLVCEWGGMNEVLADLYGLTGNREYLRLARVFHDYILDSLAVGIDILDGKHANTQIPKVIGLARQYELTGKDADRETALFFWDRVVNYHSYVTGSNALNEFFGPPGQLRDRLGPHTGETCNVYNMLKLTSHLFRWAPNAKFADYSERVILNHILASQHPETGGVTYHININKAGFKFFQDPFVFTCCVGTGMENHAKHGRYIYYHNPGNLYVSQYIASELNWRERGVRLRQETRYPKEQGSQFEFFADQPQEFTFNLRYPSWAEAGMEILVNGEPFPFEQSPGNFIPISRTWATGDIVEVNIPFSLRIETMPDDTNRIALMYGPLVLAGDLGPVRDPRIYDLVYVPLFVTNERNPNNWTVPVSGQYNTFETSDIGRPRNVTLRPFYTIYDRRYSVYWDLSDEQTWLDREARHLAILEEQRILDERTIDFFQPGDIDEERRHLFEGPQSTSHEHRNRDHRITLANGWFRFNLRTLPNQPVALNLEYWGGGYRREKSFDILVEGQKIASEDVTKARGDHFFTVEYEIPAELTRGKNQITVELRAQARRIAGPLYGARTVRR